MSAAFTHLKQIGAGCGGTVKLARRKADNKLYALKELELPRDPQEAASVLQETHILASLDHPFIVRYYDCFVESQKLFMVMEYAPNGALEQVERRPRSAAAAPLCAPPPQPWVRALPLILGSAASRFEATSQPSSDPPKTEDVRLNPLTGTLANVIAAHQKSNRHVDEAKLWGYCVQLLVALHAIHKIGIIHRDVKPHNIFLGEGDVIKARAAPPGSRAPRTP